MPISVVGAGTMGAGIAQVAAAAGETVHLYDVTETAVAGGLERIRQSLASLEKRGKLHVGGTSEILGRIQPTHAFESLADSCLVIEAVPESLEVKRQIFQALEAVCRPDAILATNTSALSVTAIGAMTKRPSRVIGLHFFNPPPLMALVEVVRGILSDEAVVEHGAAMMTAWGKSPVVVSDTPGFLVNRVARPFPGEAMQIAGEGTATPEQIDRIARRGAGFRMGPFELMDLIGQDVNHAVNRSIWQQCYFDPRFRPHVSQDLLVAAGLLGRKTGRGWYRYENGSPVNGPLGPRYALEPGPVVLKGEAVAAPDEWTGRLSAAGYRVEQQGARIGVYAGPASGVAAFQRELADDALLLVEASTLSPLELTDVNPRRVVGYILMTGGSLAELAPFPGMDEDAVKDAVLFLAGLGLDSEVVRWRPGLVSARIVAMLTNEAFRAWQEGVADAGAIDQAMRLGVNYPQGPIEWGRTIGLRRVVATLKSLQQAYGDDRYRLCPLLAEEAFQASLAGGEARP